MNTTVSKKPAEKPLFHGTPLLSWRALEYEYHEKGKLWKIAALFVVVGMVIYGILTDSYPFAIVIMLFSGVYFLTHKEPEEIEIKVTDMGVKIGKKFYEYAHIRHFWIDFRPGEVENLNLYLTKELVKEMTVLLANQDPAELRTVLSRFLPELTEKEESFADWLTRKLKL